MAVAVAVGVSEDSKLTSSSSRFIYWGIKGKIESRCSLGMNSSEEEEEKGACRKIASQGSRLLTIMKGKKKKNN